MACQDPTAKETPDPPDETGAETGADTSTDTGSGDDTDTPPEPSGPDAFGAAPDQADRVAMFDELWSELDASFAGFGATDLDWDEAYAELAPRASLAGGRGEISRVFWDLVAPLRDGHTTVFDAGLCQWEVEDRPQVAYRVNEEGYFAGVCTTPLDDGTLLVYRTAPDNPAGLAPGDVVTGYDGRPWTELWPELDATGGPVCGYHASAPTADTWYWQGAALSNTHFYEALDVRHLDGTGSSVPTEVFEGYSSWLACTDQVEQPGAPLPFTDWSKDDSYVSYGILEGTNIGYVVAYQWSSAEHDAFEAAIAALMGTDGLILDHRYNLGGGTAAAMGGLSQLFCEDVDHIMNCAFRARRSDDRTELDPADDDWHAIRDDGKQCYDRPIAVLTGPHSGSAGDLVPYYMTFHPHARRFGRMTSGSFGAYDWLWSPDGVTGEIYAWYTIAACIDADGELLQGSEQVPEFPAWLTPEDVAAGRDTVIDAARAWIEAGGG